MIVFFFFFVSSINSFSISEYKFVIKLYFVFLRAVKLNRKADPFFRESLKWKQFPQSVKILFYLFLLWNRSESKLNEECRQVFPTNSVR